MKSKNERLAPSNQKKIGPMALSHKNKSDKENQFLRDFIVKRMAETEDFAYVVSKIQFPTFLKNIDDACPIFTDKDIAFINHQIDFEKCIPSLLYVHESTFHQYTKQVWWVAPCVYWGEKLVSWVMVDKNGFHAPHPENWEDQDDVSAIFSWEMVEDISFNINEFEDHIIAKLNIEATNGGELSFYELLSLNEEPSKAEKDAVFKGSYLSVFKSIFDVNYENIIQSRGAHIWNHGVGMEGFKAFKEPSELLNQSIWQQARTGRMNYKTNSIFDYNSDLVEESEIKPSNATELKNYSESKSKDKDETHIEQKLTLQGKLAERFTSLYVDSVVKKIDDGNYLDIHLPSIHHRKGTHIWFNTTKSGGIKIGFHCRDKEFIEKAMNSSSNTIETYSNGLKLLGAPSFNNIDDAIEAVESFIADLSKKSNLQTEEKLTLEDEALKFFKKYDFSNFNYLVFF